MRRVLRSGGIAGVRDPAWGACIREPATPRLRAAHELRMRLFQHHGASPFCAPHHRRLMLEAGFARTDTTVVQGSEGSAMSDFVRFDAERRIASLRTVSRDAIALGWADQ